MPVPSQSAIQKVHESGPTLLREDHNELTLISLLYHGGSLSNPIPVYAPGSNHHARWMAKIIYTIKIALLRDQLKEFFKLQMLHSV